MRGTRPETEAEKRAFVENMQYRKRMLAETLVSMQKYYGIPVRKGAPILYGGKPATVINAWRGTFYIKIKMEDGSITGPHHPTWNIQYLEQAT